MTCRMAHVTNQSALSVLRAFSNLDKAFNKMHGWFTGLFRKSTKCVVVLTRVESNISYRFARYPMHTIAMLRHSKVLWLVNRFVQHKFSTSGYIYCKLRRLKYLITTNDLDSWAFLLMEANAMSMKKTMLASYDLENKININRTQHCVHATFSNLSHKTASLPLKIKLSTFAFIILVPAEIRKNHFALEPSLM